MDFITVDFDQSIDRSVFDCKTHPALNTYIAQHAGQDEKRNTSRTFMFVDDGLLLGYYTLANASVALDELTDELKKKMPRYPMPAVLLSRLAVDKSVQFQGLGKRLMADFFRRVYAISKHSGVAFIAVDAKDDVAAAFYRDKLGFTPSPVNPLRLFLPTATLIQGLAQKASRK
ncbi:GNAT family N-acetyltransferase [Pseudomonas coleopterorum]|uniref:GNAT family N-acetyltransferase n=1 Tax=Pseudomonas coleopterorum TaxID=1605838 RepID=UPI000899324F|nr:GNAT family N-acetyltransferase [Pseudomonas coleopterorum]SEE90633.1 Acetyltransferase (GNAT) family protein [Pseudomonas coleopterorum]